jgi:transcriptional regulator GlxA family with amidase domain
MMRISDVAQMTNNQRFLPYLGKTRSHMSVPAKKRKMEKAGATRRIVVLVVPPVEELDVVGPWEVFATANNAVRGKSRPYEIEMVTTGRALIFKGDSGLTLCADGRYNSVKGAIDTLIVPGGSGPQNVRDSSTLRWVREAAGRVRRIASICTGAFLLAEAGLLDGRRATTHWMYTKKLALKCPRVTVEPDRIYVQDGRVYTSAGVTAGMDLALALVEEDFGSAVALQVARALVLFLRRPGGQAQFSSSLSLQASEYRPLRELQVWIAENLKLNLSVENLAARAAMSPRNFARVFARESGVTPAQFVQNLRVEASRRELETTAKGLEEIAAAVGFGSAEVMRRAFQRCVGTSPGSYRERFCKGGP